MRTTTAARRPVTPRLILLLILTVLLHGCGGSSAATGSSGNGSSTGSGSSGGSSSGTTLTNFTTVTVDAGPAELASGPDGYTATNLPYVSVTICAPGSTSNCQTIDHVLLDTGSVGLRLVQSVVSSSVLGALPAEADTSGNPVGECYAYVDGYTFGSVRLADFSIGGKSVASMPLDIVGDGGPFATVPSSCSSGGGTALNTVKAIGANGILGVGVNATDCGSYCTFAGGSGAATYYDCPSSGCSSIITRSANAQAPFQQLPNPVAAFSTDNNGTVLSLPGVTASGATSVTGTLYFGISTQTNNRLGSATVLTTSPGGDLTTNYNGTALPYSFIDSGSNFYFFVDNAIPVCTRLAGFYCPTSSLLLSPMLTGKNGKSASGAFTLNNAETQPDPTANVVPGIGVNPNSVSFGDQIKNSFDFGLPFFLGRNVYTAIAGRNAGGTVGPYYAF